MHSNSTLRSTTATALAGLATGAGLAAGYAGWMPVASAHVAPGDNVTAVVRAMPAGPTLFPGRSGAVTFRVHNPTRLTVTFTRIRFGAVVSDDPRRCPATNLLTHPGPIRPLTVAASSTSAPVAVTAAVTLAADAPAGCAGRTFTLQTALTGAAQG